MYIAQNLISLFYKYSKKKITAQLESSLLLFFLFKVTKAVLQVQLLQVMCCGGGDCILHRKGIELDR